MFAPITPKIAAKLAAKYGRRFVYKPDDQKVARLMMDQSGCHQVNIYVLSTKHRKMMAEKKQYKPSHLSRCVQDDLRASRLSSFKPRLSDAFLSIPTYSADADDESADDLRSSRRMTPAFGPSKLKRKADVLTFSTEDEEMCDSQTPKYRLATAKDLTSTCRFRTFNDHLYVVVDEDDDDVKDPISFSKRPRNLSNVATCKPITPDPTAKVMEYSDDKNVLYKDDCECDFCRLLRQYDGNPLLFSGRFTSNEGHGFFTKL